MADRPDQPIVLIAVVVERHRHGAQVTDEAGRQRHRVG